MKPIVPYIDLVKQNEPFKNSFKVALEKLLDEGHFILGERVNSLEGILAKITGSKYCILTNNGTSSLYLGLRGLGVGIGDEVITPPNSYLASTSSIVLTGATPIFCDIDDDLNLNPESVESLINSKTKAVMVVHLTGKPAKILEIRNICKRHGLLLIEDCAQAIGAKVGEKHVGLFGDIGCFSAHPLKNLGALGDGGFIITNDKSLNEYLKLARNHGHTSRDECAFWSHNMRLDPLQAAFLEIKLSGLANLLKKRRKNADTYRKNLSNLISIPQENKDSYSTYHTFVVRGNHRDQLADYLLKNGKGGVQVHGHR